MDGLTPISPPRNSRLAALRRWLSRWGVVAFCLLFIGWEAVNILHHPERGDWATCYLKAARRMSAGENIHRPNEVFAYTYPPLMAWLVTPVADWSPRQAQRAFFLVNAAATAVGFRMAWRLVGGSSVVQLPRRWQIMFWISAALAIRFVSAPITHRQFDAVIAAVLFSALWLLWNRREWAAGIGLGLAAAMKCTPLIFVPYLVWRRRFAAAAIAVAVAGGVNLVPDWTHPRRDGGSYLADWDQHFLRHTARHAPGQWFADLRHNQSLSGVVNRGWRIWQAGSMDPAVLKSELRAADRRAIRLGTAALGLIAVSLGGWPLLRTLGAGPLKQSPLTGAEAEIDRDPLDFALEASVVLCLMLLISPMTSKAHFVVLLLPVLVLTRWTIVEQNPRGRWFIAALFITGFGTSRDLVGRSATDMLHMLGAPTLHLSLMLWGCCHAITRRQEQTMRSCQSPAAPQFSTIDAPRSVTRAA